MSTDAPFDRPPAMPIGLAFASLLQAVTGLRNRNAIVVLLGCEFVGIVVSGLLLAIAGGPGLLVLLAALVWLLALATGINAAGLLQMDHARRISSRSLGDALVHGLTCVPKLIVLALMLFAAAIAVFIVLALLLVICKIPFLGPLLFVVVFPLSVIVAGITVIGSLLCGVLSLPAIWQGAGVARALAQTFAIVSSRLVETVLLLVVLGLICFAVGAIVFGVLMAGMMPTLGLSLSIVGFAGIGSEEMLAMAQGYTIDGHALAGLFGGLLLWAVAGSLVGQVSLLGLSLVYLRVTEGLDLSASEAALRAAFEQAKRRLGLRGGKGRQAEPASFTAAPSSYFERSASAGFPPITSVNDDVTTLPAAARPEPQPATGTDIDLPLDVAAPYGAPPAWSPPREAPATSEAQPLPGALPPAPPLPAITTCPQCLSSVAPEDVFCGVCGYRLK